MPLPIELSFAEMLMSLNDAEELVRPPETVVAPGNTFRSSVVSRPWSARFSISLRAQHVFFALAVVGPESSQFRGFDGNALCF